MTVASITSQAQEVTKQQLVYLVSGYIAGILSRTEIAKLENWLLQSIHHQLLFAELLLPYNIKNTRQEQHFSNKGLSNLRICGN
jgi:hypothetical protein